MIEALIFDLDQTLIESQHIEPLRRKRNWSAVYREIPNIKAYEGINELLSVARDKGLKLAIVTSSPKPYAQQVVKHFNWSFDAMVCYHDTKEHKPLPAPLIKAVDRLAVKAEDCWAIGDDKKDIVAAKAAYIYSVGVLWGSINKQSLISEKPDVIFETVTSLSNSIRNLNNTPDRDVNIIST